MSALPPKADMCAANADVCFGPIADICTPTRSTRRRDHVRSIRDSDRESGLPQTVMSALLLKADMCGATSNVGYGPIADIRNDPTFGRPICDLEVAALVFLSRRSRGLQTLPFASGWDCPSRAQQSCPPQDRRSFARSDRPRNVRMDRGAGRVPLARRSIGPIAD